LNNRETHVQVRWDRSKFPKVLFNLEDGVHKELLMTWAERNGYKSVHMADHCGCPPSYQFGSQSGRNYPVFGQAERTETGDSTARIPAHPHNLNEPEREAEDEDAEFVCVDFSTCERHCSCRNRGVVFTKHLEHIRRLREEILARSAASHKQLPVIAVVG
jgi:hypothetical protein